MGNPALFSGNFVKFLKSNLNLGDKAYVLTGVADPTSVAQNGPAGSVYMQTVAGTANLYLKQDAGLTTNWQPFLTNVSLLALELEMQIRDWHEDAPYRFTTPNIVAYKAATLVSAFTGTAAYDNVGKTLSFPTIGDKVTSVQMLDPGEFLNVASVVGDVGAVDLLVYWKTGAIDTAALYEVSRDGGANWQTMTMQNAGTATEAFYGTLTFTTEPSNVSLFTQASSTTPLGLANPAFARAFAQKFIVPASTAQVVRSVTFNNAAPTGSPVGTVTFYIVRDVAGSPSTVATDILFTSSALSASTAFPAGDNTFALTNTLLQAGTYWFVIFGDSTYAAASTSNFINFNAIITGGNGVGLAVGASASTISTVTWNVATGAAYNLRWTLAGRPLDLRVRITSSVTASKLTAWSVSYGTQIGGTVTALRKTQRFTFNSVTDNLSSFAITAFTPDPDLLTCWYIQGGQGFKVPSFDLQGNTAVFPANSFNNGGVSTTITLIFDQNNGGAFDNSDANANLLAQNHLGSASGIYDRSVSGRGILLRNASGLLRELALDAFDNVQISTVP